MSELNDANCEDRDEEQRSQESTQLELFLAYRHGAPLIELDIEIITLGSCAVISKK
jgi:hypothetical protein